MEIRIYQIDPDRDAGRAAFSGLAHAEAGEDIPEIDSGIYDLAFSGNVSCGSLEEVFRLFNLEPPAGFSGRSLSVSDIVQVMDGAGVPSGSYYCDTAGFREVRFDPGPVPEPEQGDTLRVVVLEPGKEARVSEVGASLEEMQAAVGGYIEAVYPFGEEAAIICNEEGKLLGLPLNRALRHEDTGEIYDIIAGTCFICDCSGENFGSLGPEQVRRYADAFRRPELFFKVSGHIISIPYEPEPAGPMPEDRSR